MAQKVAGVLVHARLAPSDVLVHLTLHVLPALAPEPGLLGGYRETRAQLEHAVLALDKLHMRARLIEMMAPPHLRGQRQNAARLESEKVASLHARSIAGFLYYRKTAT